MEYEAIPTNAENKFYWGLGEWLAVDIFLFYKQAKL